MAYELLGLLHYSYTPGNHCGDDFDGCTDRPCLAEQKACTDLNPEQHKFEKRAYDCGDCPTGYELINGECMGKRYFVILFNAYFD